MKSREHPAKALNDKALKQDAFEECFLGENFTGTGTEPHSPAASHSLRGFATKTSLLHRRADGCCPAKVSLKVHEQQAQEEEEEYSQAFGEARELTTTQGPGALDISS